MVPPCFCLGSPLVPRGFALVPPWFFLGSPLVPRGFALVPPCPLGSPLVLPWFSLGSPLVPPWFPLGSPWFPLGSPLVPPCFFLVSSWFLLGCPFPLLSNFIPPWFPLGWFSAWFPLGFPFGFNFGFNFGFPLVSGPGHSKPKECSLQTVTAGFPSATFDPEACWAFLPLLKAVLVESAAAPHGRHVLLEGSAWDQTTRRIVQQQQLLSLSAQGPSFFVYEVHDMLTALCIWACLVGTHFGVLREPSLWV